MVLALAFLTACTTNEPDEPDTPPTSEAEYNGPMDDDGTAGSAALIADFINENRSELEAASEPLLATMGDGATVDFLAADDEFIYVYTYGDFPSEGLVEILETILEASAGMYTMLAGEMAQEIGLDTLTITVRYYDAEGNFLIEDSFTN